MIWHIAKKEILNNIKTFRFFVGTVLFLGLVTLFTHVLINDHLQKRKNYDELVQKNEDKLHRLMVYENLRSTVYNPPELFSIFSKGVVDNVGTVARINLDRIPVPENATMLRNPLCVVFPVFDIAVIIKIVITIFTLLIAYDAVSGEKEDKTLALMLSNSIPRYKILSGKFISGLVTIAIPITLGYLFIALRFLLSPHILVTSTEWLRVGALYFLTLLFFGLLLSLGLLISSLTGKSSVSLIILLLIWIVFAYIIPNVSSYASSYLKPIRSRKPIEFQARNLWQEYEQICDTFQDENHPGNVSVSQKQSAFDWYIQYANKPYLVYKQKYYSYTVPVKNEYAHKISHLEMNYYTTLKQQKRLMQIMSRISPFSVFEIAFSRLSRSDAVNCERFFDQAAEYRNQIIDYLVEANAFSSLRYFSSMNDEYLAELDDSDSIDDIKAKLRDREEQPINMTDFPRFLYRTETVNASFAGVLMDVGMLFVVTVVLFFCGCIAFVKYDAR